MNVLNRRGWSMTSDSSRTLMMPWPSGVGPQQVVDVELRLAEEDVGALLLEHDDRAQEHADRGARHAAVVGEDGLALVGREELERGGEVLEVEQRQAVVVAVLEDQGQDRGLGLVEVQDLAHQQRAERVDRGPDLGAELARRATGTRTGWPDAWKSQAERRRPAPGASGWPRRRVPRARSGRP